MPAGKLITIEGIDGAGKTTLATGLRAALRARNVPVTLLREPGGVALAERIRALVKDPELEISPRSEALLYAAARTQLVEQAVQPRLARAEWVLLDRYIDSSLAYQGAGRELGIEAVRTVNQFATGGLTPDRTLLLVLDPAAGRERSVTRGEPPDRLEREEESFFARIAAAYLELGEREPERFRLLDATQPPAVVLEAALHSIADLL